MLTQTQELRRLSISLLTSGALLLLLGGVAALWPQDTLIGALIAGGMLAGLFGVYDIVTAIRARRTSPEWWLLLAHGAAFVGFAGLTLGFPLVRLRTAMFLIALWLVLHSVLTGGLALAFWPMRRTRWALLAWTIANLVLAVSVAASSAATILDLLYYGAVYAATLGAFQIACGLWVRRIVLPRVAPAIQSTWRTRS